MYKLKPNQEAFDVVDGPYAGKKYKAGVVYDDVPPQEKHRFEKQRTEARCQVSGPRKPGLDQDVKTLKPDTRHLKPEAKRPEA